MFSLLPLSGYSLPSKTVCLTFDDGPGETLTDGPGPKTLQLAQYLHSENIKATFFCLGEHILKYRSIVLELDRLGHFIGNHSFTHPYFFKDLYNNGQFEKILEEVVSTDLLLIDLFPDKNIYFRAPFGDWHQEISAFLNKSFGGANRYIGPFGWEVDSWDYGFWERHKSAQDCANHFLPLIEAANHGVLIMHDSSANNEDMRLNNQTYEAIKILVPILKEKGFHFVGIDKL